MAGVDEAVASADDDALDVRVVGSADGDLPRVIYIREFGGFGNDSVSFAAADLGELERRQRCGEALRAALAALELPRPMALQVGCVPSECELVVRRVIEEAFDSGLSFVARVGEAQRYRSPVPCAAASADSAAAALAPPPPAEAQDLRLERLDRSGHDFEPWLLQQLTERGYPPAYVRHLIASGDVACPLVAVAGDDGRVAPVAMVLQEATDLSVGALQVDEGYRRRGIGAWLFACMSAAIQHKHAVSAASLVEPGNEASQRLHERAGWTRDAGSLVWLAFT
eukprot:TRINITY_DN9837_c0_g1_i1.p1 TRINITY_DN9837_c0_g1~~TRINITY_DN9837_c0_g1_i1.p1  ORF type:complete len:282 (+),score=79.31 TRINITY_DN9837_c0_g1_i1:44-889(+)